jgi:dynein heavy chain
MFPFTRDKASFRAPQTLTMYERYMQHINDNFKEETPLAFGLHPNAEIGFRTEVGEGLFATIAAMRPIEVVAVEGESNEHIAGTYLLDVLEEYREASFDIAAVRESVGDAPGPFQTVFTQVRAAAACPHHFVRSWRRRNTRRRNAKQ